MAKEIERSFLFNKNKCVESGFVLHKTMCEINCVRIVQNYLIPQNSEIRYSRDFRRWEVTLKHNGAIRFFTVDVNTSDHNEIITALSTMEGVNGDFSGLEGVRLASSRIRLIDGKTVFTFKSCAGDPLMRDEFEYVIDNSNIYFPSMGAFTDLDPFAVKKWRYSIDSGVVGSDKQKIIIEIDEFDNPAIGSYLEAEFCSLSDAMAFDFTVWGVGKEITGVDGFTNKELAINAGLKQMSTRP